MMLNNLDFTKKESTAELNLNKEISTSTRGRKSLRLANNNQNQDYVRNRKSISQFSNLANYDYDLKRGESGSSFKPENKNSQNMIEALKINELNTKLFSGLNHNDCFGDMKHDVLSIENNDDLLNDYDRWKNWPIASKCLSNVSRDNDIGYLNGRFDHSKRGSLISNLSAFFYKNDPKED